MIPQKFPQSVGRQLAKTLHRVASELEHRLEAPHDQFHAPLVALVQGSTKEFAEALQDPVMRKSMNKLNMFNCDHASQCMTAMINAVLHNDFEKVRLLLEAGADVEAVDLQGRGPLSYALNNLEMTKLLIEHGANVNSALQQDAQRSRVYNGRAFQYALDHAPSQPEGHAIDLPAYLLAMTKGEDTSTPEAKERFKLPAGQKDSSFSADSFFYEVKYTQGRDGNLRQVIKHHERK